MTEHEAAALLGIDRDRLTTHTLDALLRPHVLPSGERYYERGLVGYMAAAVAAVVEARAAQPGDELTACQAAQILGISIRRLRALDAQLQPSREPRGWRRYRRDHLDAIAATDLLPPARWRARAIPPVRRPGGSLVAPFAAAAVSP